MTAEESQRLTPHYRWGFEDLPNEVLEFIVKELNSHDQANASVLDKRFHEVVEPHLYSVPLNTKFRAGYILRTLLHKPELGLRFTSLRIEKPDGWFSWDDGPVLERVNLDDVFDWRDWLVVNRDPWGECLRRKLNWDACMASLIKHLPNLETLYVGYHAEKLFHMRKVITRAGQLQREPILSPERLNASLPRLRSITYRTNDSSVTLSHLIPYITIPSLQTFSCEEVKSKALGTYDTNVIKVQSMKLTLCALSIPDLQRFLPKCVSLKSFTFQYGNYESQSEDSIFPLSEILYGLRNSRNCLEELRLTDHADWRTRLEDDMTCSLHRFPNIRILEIQTAHFLDQLISPDEPFTFFDFRYLPPALESLTLNVTNDHHPSLIRDELVWNTKRLFYVPGLKNVHTQFLQQDQARHDVCWPKLTRRYMEAGVQLSFDFLGGVAEPRERVIFGENDHGWLEPWKGRARMELLDWDDTTSEWDD